MQRDKSSLPDIHAAVERFLDDTQTRRPESVSRRYSKALELFLTFLAVELLDPDQPEDDSAQGPGDLHTLTPDLLTRYVGEFLVERIGPTQKAVGRHVAAVKAFIRFLASRSLIALDKANELADALDAAQEYLEDDRGFHDPVRHPRLCRIVSLDDDRAVIEDLATTREITVDLSNPHELDVQQDRVYLVTLVRTSQGPLATLLGLLDTPLARLADHMDKRDWQEADEDPSDEDAMDIDDMEDWWEDDPDFDLLSGDPLGSDIFSLTPEDALEILSIEDRFAPRKVVETMMAHYDEVRSSLLDWLHDEQLRSVPLPGMGEAPANAARILSEMGEIDIAPRLLSILGQMDPLGEEAPPALARLGPEVLPMLEKVLKEKRQTSDRRVATLWAIGYMAARHPAVRVRVVDVLWQEILKNKPEAQTALIILTELRAAEILPKIRKAVQTGKVDLEALGHTMELVEDRMTSPAWGEIVGEILVPVVYLYPTDEQLEEVYESIGMEMNDYLSDELDDDWDEFDWNDEDPRPDPRPSPKKKKRPSPQKKDSRPGAKVIPFRPKDDDEEDK